MGVILTKRKQEWNFKKCKHVILLNETKFI